jgi:hypothetical protein
MFKSKFRACITALVLSLAIMLYTTPAFAESISAHGTTPMRNAGLLSKTYIIAAQRLIAELVFSQLAGGSGTIIDNGVVRIDRQGQTGTGDLNLQVQIDGLSRASTIAAALIPNQYFNGVTNPGTMAEVQRVVRSALVQSLDSLRNGHGEIFGLQGNPSN